MEGRFGADLGHVRVHTGAQSAQLNRDLHSNAFTHERDVFFGEGKQPGNNELTAHELTHVLQQSGGVAGGISARSGPPAIQRDIIQSTPVSNGGFETHLETRRGALTGTGASGMDGYIRFVPNLDAPNSNEINMIQIVRLTDAGGTDVSPGSMGPGSAQEARGALGTGGVRTEEDTTRGVEGGFFTDVPHQAGTTVAPAGSPLSPNYDFNPAAPGTTGVVGTVQQPAQYGGGIGGDPGHVPGFKRSNDPADIRSAALYDTPGTTSATDDLDFSFESVAMGTDSMFTYGSATWGFSIRAGDVTNEFFGVSDGQSATFDEALERHRDFYVHEPVTFHFGFDSAVLDAGEAAKIDSFLAYLAREPAVQLSLSGFADIVGGASAYNVELSRRRARAVRNAMIARGIDAARISAAFGAAGASTAATTDAGTGDQGGDPLVGADQSREANRSNNRRVVLTFIDPSAATPAPAPGTGP